MTTETDDPFASLENEVRRQDSEERGLKAMRNARTRLVLGRESKHVFFATLALRLELQVDWQIETMATDGKTLHYNPDWVLQLNEHERVGVVAHEVMHNALAHPSRRGGREVKKWNVACDLAINGILKEAGMTLPQGGVYPGVGKYKDFPAGKGAEEYYTLLQEPGGPPEPEGPGGGEGEGDGEGDGEGEGEGEDNDPGGCGGVKDAGGPAQQRENETEWEVAVAQAHEAAKKRGALPGGIDRMVATLLKPKVDWKDVLREFISRHARNDYAWNPPSRRFLQQGIYMPGLKSEELGTVVVAVDTSGSIGGKEIQAFGGEIQGMLEAYDVELTILYCDAKVQHVQAWKSSDGPLVMEPKGGGGTDHRPVFDYIEEHQLDPTCLVCLTDMCTTFPDREPEYPVLWASTTEGVEGPFGQTVEVDL